MLIPLSASSTDVTDATCKFSYQFSVTGFNFTTLFKMSLSSQELHFQLASPALVPWWLPPHRPSSMPHEATLSLRTGLKSVRFKGALGS